MRLKCIAYEPARGLITKAFVAIPDDLIFIFGDHMVEGENRILRVVLCPVGHTLLCVCICLHVRVCANFKMQKIKY